MPSFCASKGRYHFEAHDLKKSKVPTSTKGLGVPTSTKGLGVPTSIKCTTDATRVVAPLHVHTITNTMSATTAFFAVRAPVRVSVAQRPTQVRARALRAPVDSSRRSDR